MTLNNLKPNSLFTGVYSLRAIKSKLTQELTRFIRRRPVDVANSYPVKSYRKLVEQVAELSYLNKDHLLFFRGQNRDYKNRAGASTFYPSIYRDDYLPQGEVHRRFDILDIASRRLINLFQIHNINGHQDVKRKKYIRWSILQHYEVTATPLLDFTHSLRVAGSFAQLDNQSDEGFVYIFGLPYITNRISINSEHDIVNIRLLSICPPNALRPYFQEGYLAGTEDITNEYDTKAELDFKNRLIAKFRIPNTKRFWGRGFSALPKSLLYPKNDRVKELCQDIKKQKEQELQPGKLGEYLKEWVELEHQIRTKARTKKEQDDNTKRSNQSTTKTI